MKAPSIYQHLFSLIMPLTITVIIPLMIQPDLKSGYLLPKSVGILIGLTGITGFIYTVYLFRSKGHGTLAPWSPTQQLVVEGPYRLSRNPMITSVLFVLIGETLFFVSEALAIEAVIFFFVNTIYFIAVEEPGLEERFGERYRMYRREVPRWIPEIKGRRLKVKS